MLLLDDLLAGLDATMRSAVGEIFADAAAFSSVIVTGHEASDFAQWATRILVLRDGVIAAEVDTAAHDAEALRERVNTALAAGRGA